MKTRQVGMPEEVTSLSFRPWISGDVGWIPGRHWEAQFSALKAWPGRSSKKLAPGKERNETVVFSLSRKRRKYLFALICKVRWQWSRPFYQMAVVWASLSKC